MEFSQEYSPVEGYDPHDPNHQWGTILNDFLHADSGTALQAQESQVLTEDTEVIK